MISDCHLHTSFSTDSTTPVESQVEKAIFRVVTKQGNTHL